MESLERHLERETRNIGTARGEENGMMIPNDLESTVRAACWAGFEDEIEEIG